MQIFVLFVLNSNKEELVDGEEIARCPTCSLILRVIYDAVCL